MVGSSQEAETSSPTTTATVTKNDTNMPQDTLTLKSITKTKDEASTSNTTAATTAPTKRHITLDLIRKRSEHNESLVSNLEEIALHQEELQSIGPILGQTCGKTLRILLLQNNVISRLNPQDLKYMKRLEYLNMALNNVTVIEGLGHCEFLEKLDLTLNFIDVDGLEESVDVLSCLRSLKELYLLGNPCCGVTGSGSEGNDNNEGSGIASSLANVPKNQNKNNNGWPGCRPYVIARLPNLQTLDGKQITRSERILATQKLPTLIQELRVLAEQCLRERKKNQRQNNNNTQNENNNEEYTEHTPEARAELSNEMYQQKMEKEKNERANQPRLRGEKEFEEEQKVATEKARKREDRGDIRQCNEGKWMFQFNEEQKPGYLLLDVSIQKHLSSSLIDVDIHPTYVSIVIKSKVLRLVLPAEVKPEKSTAQRSMTTGNLLLCMPKVDPEENMVCIRASLKNKAVLKKREEFSKKNKQQMETTGNERMKSEEGKIVVNENYKDRGLASDMLREATERLGSVRVDGLVKPCNGGVVQEKKKVNVDMEEVSSRRRVTTTEDATSDSDEPPPLF